MTSCLKWICTLLLMVTVLDPGIATASSRKLGPKKEYSELERIQYWAGAFAQIGVKHCGYMKQGKELKNLVKMFEPAKYALRQWGHGDKYGGSCAEVEKYIVQLTGHFRNSVDYSSYDDELLCDFAISGKSSPKWDTSPRYMPAVTEAKSRLLTVNDCAEILGYVTATSSSDGTSSEENAKKKLSELKKLLDDGLITEDEAAEKRQIILDAL